ncbi:MAG: hypothetical protein AB1543_00735 [Candidatus Bipolaricaulota bacterium]
MTIKGFAIRDFIYLDWERVRSFSAQLLGGVPQESLLESGHEIGVEGQVEAGLWAIAKGRGGGDYRYFSGQSETRSLHHHVYALFEAALEKHNMLVDIDEGFNFALWTEDQFNDGQFVRVRGVVRLMDYAWVARMLDGLPRLMELASHVQALALKQKKDAGQLTEQQFMIQQRGIGKMEKKIKDLGLQKLTEMIDQLYGSVVRLKVVPSKAHPESIFVASGDPRCFHDSAAALSQKYGYEIDARWIALGQVNRPREASAGVPRPIGNQMEDAFEQLALLVNDLGRVISAARFPAVSLTPISVYRVC